MKTGWPGQLLNKDDMPKILALQHTPKETLGTIAYALDSVGLSWDYVRAFEGDLVPNSIDGAVGLVVMGGPMGVYEGAQYPYLKDELKLIERALKADIPVLGVCLGSQLLACALGANVLKADHREIGWHDVMLTTHATSNSLFSGIPSKFKAFHWHGDIFELPDGSSLLASSAMTVNQAFNYSDLAYGFLFHMEVTEEIITGMIDSFPDEMEEGGVHESTIREENIASLPTLQSLGEAVFGRWAGSILKTHN